LRHDCPPYRTLAQRPVTCDSHDRRQADQRQAAVSVSPGWVRSTSTALQTPL
jgi:hypothetical protein